MEFLKKCLYSVKGLIGPNIALVHMCKKSKLLVFPETAEF